MASGGVSLSGPSQRGRVILFSRCIYSSGAPGVQFDFSNRFSVCVCAMGDAIDARFEGAEETQTEQPETVNGPPPSPTPAPSEASSSGASSSNVLGHQSDLLLKIRELADTQKALKEQRKKCTLEMKNALKRKKRLQTKAWMLSDTDLVEVLRMRKERKDSARASQTMEPPEDSQPGL